MQRETERIKLCPSVGTGVTSYSEDSEQNRTEDYKSIPTGSVSVFTYIGIQIEKKRRSMHERTSEVYAQVLKSFMKFRRHRDLEFGMMTGQMIEKYESWMRSNGLCRNTTSFYLRGLRSVYNHAVEEGIAPQNNPFRKVYTGVDKTSRRAIGVNEIRRIMKLELSGLPLLDFARDIFMFSFYMRGMSFIDIAYLQKTDLSGGFVVYNRKKTGQQMVVRWEGKMEAIVRKWNVPGSRFLLPIIDTEDGTERKQYRNKMLIINRRLKVIAEMAKIKTPLTTYVARHSWASIAQEEDVPIKVISLGMGHDNETTTRIYLASIRTDVIDDANCKILELLDSER